MVSKCQLSVLLLEGKCGIKRQLYSKLSPCEKQLLLSFNTNGKDSTYPLLACILHTAALNTDPDSCPSKVKPRPTKIIYTGSSLELIFLWPVPLTAQSSFWNAITFLGQVHPVRKSTSIDTKSCDGGRSRHQSLDHHICHTYFFWTPHITTAPAIK